ncbi:hypothetical protein Trisim1_012455 [Trichoderma cf. simile WF8]
MPSPDISPRQLCTGPLIEYLILVSHIEASRPFAECAYITCSDLIFHVHIQHVGCLNLAAINFPSPPFHTTLHPPASFFSFFPARTCGIVSFLACLLCSLGIPPPCPPLHLFFFFFQTLICSSAPDSTPPSLPCTENLCVKLALRKAGPWPSQSPADLNGWMLVPGFHAGPRLRHLYLAPRSA